jgi:hypothetical protein
MKLATYRSGEAPYVGAGVGNGTRILDLARAANADGGEAGTFRTMLDLIDAGPGGLDAAANLFGCYAEETDLTVPHQSIVLEAPLPRPEERIGRQGLEGE